MAARLELHWSQVRTFLMCGERYRRRNVEGDIIPPGVALILGRSVHVGAERTLRTKLETGELPAAEAASEAARDEIHQIWQDGDYLLKPEELVENDADGWRDRLVDDAVRLVDLHHREVAPEIDVLRVEREWLVSIPRYDFDLAGKIDVEEPDAIRDLKTIGKSPSAGDVDQDDQLTTYWIARGVLDKEWVSEVRKDYLVKTKTPKHVQQVGHREQEDVAPFLRMIQEVAECIGAGRFPPTDRSNWWCGPKWCGYYDSCRYRRGRVSVAVGGGEEASQ